jgi:hypothetical protein
MEQDHSARGRSAKAWDLVAAANAVACEAGEPGEGKDAVVASAEVLAGVRDNAGKTQRRRRCPASLPGTNPAETKAA